jgi:AraC-like DNA-binding protein
VLGSVRGNGHAIFGETRPEVFAVVAGREQQARLAAGLRSRAVVQFVAHFRDLLPALAASSRLAGVIVEPRDVEGTPAAPVVARVRSAFPYTPVLVFCPISPLSAPDILAAARAGASGLIVRDSGDFGTALVTALDAADDESAARRILAELGPLPDEARAAVEFCLSNARRRLTVDDVAAALGVHRKTLAARLARAGMPSPLALVGWCRLLLAARFISEGGRSLESVAVQLEFPSASALRNMLARYTGLKPQELRGTDGMRLVAAAWRRTVEPDADGHAGHEGDPEDRDGE